MRFKTFIWGAVMTFGLASTAWGTGLVPAGVGGNPPNTFEGSLSGIEIGDEANPIPIFIIGTDLPWDKSITVPIPNGLPTGTVIPVHEALLLTPSPLVSPLPDPPLTDWHEIIHTPGWEWVPPTAAAGMSPSLVIHNRQGPTGGPFEIGGEVGDYDDPNNPGAQNNAIWFGPFKPFRPFPDPLEIWIWKELVYVGEDIPPPSSGGPEAVEIRLWEHPTVPEPSSIVLAGIAVAGLGLFALRRRPSQP